MMNKKIIIFAGSNSKESINKKLAVYVASLMENTHKNVLDLNDFELPLYGIDVENETGIPENAKKFFQILQSSDAIILSLAEHNGSYTAVFKNLFDWMSRIDKNVWAHKPMFLLSTSPGARGGSTVLESAKITFPHLGGNIVSSISVPSFYENFKDDKIINEIIHRQLVEAIVKFEAKI